VPDNNRLQTGAFDTAVRKYCSKPQQLSKIPVVLLAKKDFCATRKNDKHRFRKKKSGYEVIFQQIDKRKNGKCPNV